jgi:hypothetical protein
MAEYIERERLQEAFNADLQHLQSIDEHTVNLVLIEIDEAPAADVAEVKHGKWVDVPLNMDPSYFAYKYNLRKKCSVCKYAMPYEYPNFNICPNCGATMDGDEE